MLIVIIIGALGFLLFCYNVYLLAKSENYRQKAIYEYLRYKHNAEKEYEEYENK